LTVRHPVLFFQPRFAYDCGLSLSIISRPVLPGKSHNFDSVAAILRPRKNKLPTPYFSCFSEPTEAIQHTTIAPRSPRWRPQLAALKSKKSRKKRARLFTYFPQVKGKIVESIEIDANVSGITIIFEDKTALSFKLEPRLTVFPELSDWKTGEWRGIKRWHAPFTAKALCCHGHNS
jgi:hypothetical protein